MSTVISNWDKLPRGERNRIRSRARNAALKQLAVLHAAEFGELLMECKRKEGIPETSVQITAEEYRELLRLREKHSG